MGNEYMRRACIGPSIYLSIKWEIRGGTVV